MKKNPFQVMMEKTIQVSRNKLADLLKIKGYEILPTSSNIRIEAVRHDKKVSVAVLSSGHYSYKGNTYSTLPLLAKELGLTEIGGARKAAVAAVSEEESKPKKKKK